ncbi:MAG: dihydrolipoyl dehydrogenase [Duncaniella sp.]|nr:dihydrolipoyl dehydrogenase [Duncaniella sp.]
MTTADIIIIGAGPGGYELAAREAARGKNVVLIERDKAGGTCLNRGCIPTKVLCRSAEVAETVREAAEYGVSTADPSVDITSVYARKDSIVSQLRAGVESLLDKVTVISGTASFTPDGKVAVNDEIFSAKRIVIATGSAPSRLKVDGAELAMTSDDVLSRAELPDSVVIIGGGVIGMEFASVYAAFGVKVTVIEYCKEIIPPLDSEVAKRLRTSMKRRGIDIVTGAQVSAISRDADGILKVNFTEKGKEKAVRAEWVISATGRRPVIPDGFTQAGGELDSRGFIKVNDEFATSIPGVYAIGDVNGKCMLAHAATAQGQRLTGEDVDLDVVPAAVFTSPECAMAGMTEDACREAGLDYSVKKSTFRANGKAVALGLTDGLVKIIVDNGSGLILGAHICGPQAAVLIQEIATVMAARLPATAVTRSIHPHPTLNEAVQAAFLL